MSSYVGYLQLSDGDKKKIELKICATPFFPIQFLFIPQRFQRVTVQNISYCSMC